MGYVWGSLLYFYRAPDDSLTKASEGLRSSSVKLEENSGISRLMEQWFGKWSGLMTSFLVSIAVAMALVTVCVAALEDFYKAG